MSFSEVQRPSTQIEVLEAFVAFLRAEFSDWHATSIYWTDLETPPVDTNLSKFITVHAGGGQFDAGALDGGHACLEDASIAVKIWRRSEIDQQGHADSSLLQADEGLMKLKQRVLRALKGKMLRDEDDAQIAISTVHPLSAGEPSMGNEQYPLDTLAVAFAVKFEWDLS